MKTAPLWIIAGLLSVTLSEFQAAQSDAPFGTDKVSILGNALNMSNTATGANQTIRININGWSTPSQRQNLIGTLLEKGQDALLKAIEKQPELGRFNFQGYLGPDQNNTMRIVTEFLYARHITSLD